MLDQIDQIDENLASPKSLCTRSARRFGKTRCTHLLAMSDAGRRTRNADLSTQVLPDGEVGYVGAVEAAEEGGEALEPACAFEPCAPLTACG
jgi:hypothetical protein